MLEIVSTIDDVNIDWLTQPVGHTANIIDDYLSDVFAADAEASNSPDILPESWINSKTRGEKCDNSPGLESNVSNTYNLPPFTRELSSVSVKRPGGHSLSLNAEKRCMVQRATSPCKASKSCLRVSPAQDQNFRKTDLEWNNTLLDDHKSQRESVIEDKHRPLVKMSFNPSSCNFDKRRVTSSSIELEKVPVERRDKDIILGLYQAMETSKRSHQLINEWDAKMGLKKSHSKTMSLSSQSRDDLMGIMFSSSMKRAYSAH